MHIYNIAFSGKTVNKVTSNSCTFNRCEHQFYASQTLQLLILAPTLEVQSNATVGEGIGSVEICAVGGDATVPVVLVATGHCTSYHACGTSAPVGIVRR